jgi:hypothetical protein
MIEIVPALSELIQNTLSDKLSQSVMHQKMELATSYDYEDMKFYPCNPSITGRHTNIRLVNYTIDPQNGQYSYPGPSVRTFNMLQQNEKIGWLGEDVTQGTALICGCEDVRMVEWDNTLYYTCVVVRDQATQMMLHCIPKHHDGSLDLARRQEWELSDGKTRNEKNWLPFVHTTIFETGDSVSKREDLCFICAYDPHIIIKRWCPDTQQAVDYRCGSIPGPTNLHMIRGSAGPVYWMDAYYILVHQVVTDNTTQKRIYVHRFLKVHANSFDLGSISLPFRFMGNSNIEFASTIILRAPAEIVIGWGEFDNRAWLTSMPAALMEHMCDRELPAFSK